MHRRPAFLAACLISLLASPALAQTADDIIERSLTALGGRAAHAKITSRLAKGEIVLATPAGDIPGTIEISNAAPNKSRSVISADLSAFGAGPLVIDQRFNGTAGYVLDSLQGNREITGAQLDNMKSSSFPHPFLAYMANGTTATLKGKEKVGDREAYVVVFDPPAGSDVRQYIDAETFLPMKSVVTVSIPQLGRDVEQTSEILEYRDVDGVKVPVRIRSFSEVQGFTITIKTVEHNVTLDEALFSKPAQ
ncbi:MAG: hypothetical protein AB1635_17050 [Acidobacteriota bacterium]